MTTRTVAMAGLAGVGVAACVEYRRARRLADTWQPPAGERRRAGALTVRTTGDAGSPVLLLHGLVASGVFWGAAYDALAARHRLVVPDLLGFGGSDRPEHGYGPDEHVQALVRCLDVLGVEEPVAIGAHSLGCLVALRLAATHPERVSRVIGFGPPIYKNPADARARVGASGPMARLMALPGPVAQVACGWVCRHRSIAARLAVLTHPRLPSAIASDAVQHTWTSYSKTLGGVILDADALGWLDAIDVPIVFIAGDHDPVVDHDLLVFLGETRPGITVHTWIGEHDLPLVEAERCAAAIARFVEVEVVADPI